MKKVAFFDDVHATYLRFMPQSKENILYWWLGTSGILWFFAGGYLLITYFAQLFIFSPEFIAAFGQHVSAVRLHRHTAPRVLEAAVDSMEAPPFMAG